MRRKDMVKARPAAVDLPNRLPYSKPTILTRESLEVMAGICPAPQGKGAGVCSIPNT